MKIRQWSGILIGIVVIVLMQGAWVTSSKTMMPAAAMGEPRWSMGKWGTVQDVTHITDLENDGISEIVGCGTGSPFAAHRSPVTGNYVVYWFGGIERCDTLAMAPLYNEEAQTIFMGTGDDFIYRFQYNGETYLETARFPMPPEEWIRQIAMGNVDADPMIELVVTTETHTRVYDAASLALEWEMAGYGGMAVGIGNFSDYPHPLIFVAGESGYLLDATTQSVVHTIVGPFTTKTEIGNIDEDAQDEIVFVKEQNLIALDAERGALAIKWQRLLGNNYVQAIEIADLDDDLGGEVVTYDQVRPFPFDYKIAIYHGATGAFTRSISDVYSPYEALAVGDTDNNGTIEIVNGEKIFDAESGELIESTWRMSYPFHSQVAIGDLNNDGIEDLVVNILSDLVVNPYPLRTIQGFFGPDLIEQWEQSLSHTYADLALIGPFDEDPQGEILITWVERKTSEPIPQERSIVVQSMDSDTRTIEWEYRTPAEMEATGVAVASGSIDADPQHEIAIALRGASRLLKMHDGASDTVLWQISLPSAIEEMEIVDIDGDGTMEVVTLAVDRLRILDATTGAQESETLTHSLFRGQHLAIVRTQDGLSEGILMVGIRAGAPWLFYYDSNTLTLQWEHQLPQGTVYDLVAMEGQAGGGSYFAVGGLQPPSSIPTYLYMGIFDEAGVYGYFSETRNWGGVQDLAVGDFLTDDPPEQELVVAFRETGGVQLRRIEGIFTPVPTPTVTPTPTITPTATPTIPVGVESLYLPLIFAE